jgi:hypothetical protein
MENLGYVILSAAKNLFFPNERQILRAEKRPSE